MRMFVKACAIALSLSSLGVSAARAEHRENEWSADRPDYCSLDHDHRSHDRNYYDYYDKDRYYRASPNYYSSSRYDSGRYDRRYGDRYGYYNDDGYDGRVVSRRTHRIPGLRATAYVTEREFHSYRGHQRVCTISLDGPDAHYVNRRDLKWVASTHCSSYAKVRYS